MPRSRVQMRDVQYGTERDFDYLYDLNHARLARGMRVMRHLDVIWP